jgi:hypothetical protein
VDPELFDQVRFRPGIIWNNFGDEEPDLIFLTAKSVVFYSKWSNPSL